jgi:RND family efflux transporter MFP subunit
MESKMNKLAPAAAALSLLIAACGEKPVEEQEEIARPVKIITFGGAGAAATLEYSGTIAAAQRSDMGFEVPGRVTEFLVSAGEQVEEGKVLARLDPEDYQAELDKAVANRNAADADFRRYQQAFNEKRNLDVAVASLRTARKAVSDTELKAPFAGVVAQKLVNDFANVQAKEPILVLEDDSSLEIDVNVPERDWAQAKPNISLEERSARADPRVRITAIPDRVFPAQAKEIDTTADPVTRTYSVTFSFEKPTDIIVRPGMTAAIVLSVPSDVTSDEMSAGTAVPSTAVRSDEAGNAFVWRVGDDMRVSKQLVGVGELSGNSVRILDGLEPGMRIAASGVHNLREGMLVTEYQP